MNGDICLYPYNLEAQKLPVYLTGIGGSAYQPPVRRPEGYFWHQVLFCMEGSGVLEVHGQKLAVRAGDAFVLPAGLAHAYWPEERCWDVRWLTFDGSAAGTTLTCLGLAETQIISGGAATLLPFYEKMHAEITGDWIHGHYTCSALVYSCLTELRRLIIDQADAHNRILTLTLRFIDEHYGSDVSLADMAEQAGVTPQHLCRVFRASMHMRPGEYLARRRVQAAQTLIRTGNLPLSEIARQTGFASPGYFSTVFRRCVGMSPGEYRRRMGS